MFDERADIGGHADAICLPATWPNQTKKGQARILTRVESGALFPVHTETKMLHDQQGAGDHGEHAGDPKRDGKSEQEVQAEHKKENCQDEVSHKGTMLSPTIERRQGVLAYHPGKMREAARLIFGVSQRRRC